ncbi:MAG TPA: hypothetical protein VHV30_10845 [Polyangiaceae bacterium]|jgi:hypothetical protein|nr:hypothetical protein [Polyangiaceae bacterium]
MSETRKSREPGPERPRLSRDPRIDSTPPSAVDEAPLAHLQSVTQHVAHTFSRPVTRPPETERVATLEAEVERLRGELALDADDTAGMLVRIVESERLQLSAHAQAVEASARAAALEAELAKSKGKASALEAEIAGLRQQWVLAEARLSATREAMRNALAVVEELERREEVVATLRGRTIREALKLLRGETLPRETLPPPSAESSVAVRGSDDAPPESGNLGWDLDLAK